jgi:hypothetical protein
MTRISRGLVLVLTSIAIIGCWQLWSSGQQPATAPAKAAGSTNRLEFEVVESYDAKYLGDTPGHMGRTGGLENAQIRIALRDPIYRGDEVVGRVTRLIWNRVHGSLDIEFDPVDHARVCVGDKVVVALDGTQSASSSGPQRAK